MDMSSKKKKTLVFIFFGVVWILIIAYNLWYFFGSQGRSANVHAFKNHSGLSVQDVREVRLDMLERHHQSYKGIVKDIFRPISFVQKTAPVVTLPPPPPPKPKEPTHLETFASEIKFLGFLEKESSKIVFISKGADVFLVKKGDLITGAFKITDITATTMSIRDEKEGQEIKIELVRQ